MSLDRLRYALLRSASFFLHWSRRRLTPAGQVGWAALAAAAALGLDTNQSMAYQGFTFLAPLLLVSWFAALRGRARFTASRQLPRLATAGQPLSYRVRVTNTGTVPLRGASVTECVADPRPDFARFHEAPGRAGEHWLERLTGYGRWSRLVAGRRIAGEAERALPDLPPGGSCDAVLEVVPSRRGVLRLSSCELSRPETMGLFKARVPGGQPSQVLVLPRRHPVGRLELGGGRRYQQGGVSLASRVGDSPEFMALRDYRPGDPLRRIHWRSWAKTGKPVVREYQDEYFTRHALALDTFAPPGGEEVFEEAVSAAASLACSALTQESLLDMLFIGTRAYCFTAGRGLGGPETLLEALACAEPCAGRPFSELRAAIETRRGLLSGCVCVLLAWDEERRALVAGLRASAIPVMALVVAAPEALPDAVCAAEGLARLEPGRLAEGLARLPSSA